MGEPAHVIGELRLPLPRLLLEILVLALDLRPHALAPVAEENP